MEFFVSIPIESKKISGEIRINVSIRIDQNIPAPQ